MCSSDLARASLAVGVATKSRQEFDRALEALDRVLEIWTFTPYTSNHIQATYTKALTLSSLAFFPQRHEGFDRLEREGTAMNSPLGDLIKNVAQDAHRQRDLLDQAVRLRTPRKILNYRTPIEVFIEELNNLGLLDDNEELVQFDIAI